jgi:hypothetical protein
MTNSARKASAWTNTEIEEDSSGYIAAQKAEREDRMKEAERKRQADELRHFERTYIAAGGSRSEAAAAYRAHKNEHAEQAAAVADEEARRYTRSETWRVI